jgi:hypothetical protein
MMTLKGRCCSRKSKQRSSCYNVKALAELLNAKPGEIPAPSLEASFHPVEFKISKAKCRRRVSLYSHSQLIWARAVFGLFSNNVGPFSLNLVLTARCSHLMWSRHDGCFRVGSFTSGRYT